MVNRKNKPHKPRVVQVSITDRCQCACKHCGISFLSGDRRRPDPSFEEIRKIFLDLKTFKCEVVDLFGGEPTLRKDLCEIVALGTSYGFTMLLETNGVLLDRPYLERLKEAGLNLIYLSLDDCMEEVHDANRGRKGVFRAAVGVMNIARDLGMFVHTSMVPKGKEYFEDGRINKYVRFCLENGAEKVRILFPSCVGKQSLSRDSRLSEKEEREVFGFLKREYRKYVYVEDMENNKVLGEKTVCPAKSIFCHITTSGKVLPCPYLPMAFGDIKKEPLLNIFDRIQGHPFMKEHGSYCPTRDSGFIKKHLCGVGPEKPYVTVAGANHVNVEGGCNNGCRSCGRDKKKRTMKAVLGDIARVDSRYSTLDLFGGEPFARKDIFDLLDRVPSRFGLNLYSNARAFSYPEAVKRLKKYRIHCFKVPVFSPDRAKFEAFTRVKGSFAQTLTGIRNLSRAGFPVSLFLPEAEAAGDWKKLTALGAVSVSSYAVSEKDALPDSVLCFGKKIGKVSLLWLRTGEAGGEPG